MSYGAWVYVYVGAKFEKGKRFHIRYNPNQPFGKRNFLLRFG